MLRKESGIAYDVHEFLTQLYSCDQPYFILDTYIPMIRNKQNPPRNIVYLNIAKKAIELEKKTGKNIKELIANDPQEKRLYNDILTDTITRISKISVEEWNILLENLNSNEMLSGLAYNPELTVIYTNLKEMTHHCNMTALELYSELRAQSYQKSVDPLESESSIYQRELDLLKSQIDDPHSYEEYVKGALTGTILNRVKLYDRILELEKIVDSRKSVSVDAQTKCNILRNGCMILLNDSRFSSDQVGSAIMEVAINNNYRGFSSAHNSREEIKTCIPQNEILNVCRWYLGSNELNRNSLVKEYQNQMIREYNAFIQSYNQEESAPQMY